jgi:hypothetical protein
MRATAVLVWACLVAGCSATPASSAVHSVTAPQAATDVVVARGPDSITLQPSSPSGRNVGVAFDYDMPHCGINSPIDVDGSFWDAVSVAPDSVEFDGAVGSFRLISDRTAAFTRSDGQVLNLVRHDGPKEFRICS